MSTPAYVPPSVGPAGLTIPSYPSILQDNLTGFLNIFGQNQYVGIDSAIYQLLSILSLKQYDCMLGLQLAFNQSSPATAVGAGLDRVVKMNGLFRAAFTFSTVVVQVSGTPNGTVTNGIAQDSVTGYQWALPTSVQIPSGGSISVTATCTTPGNISAEEGDISIIATPQSTWTSVTNPAAATAGDAVEADSKLRARQAVSVALPSQTRLQGTIAALEQLPGVTRVAQGIPTPDGPGSSAENPTGADDSWGNPPHSITMVVEGGTEADIALAIYENRSIGCDTNGTTTVTVTDPNTSYQMEISFYLVSYVTIGVLITLHQLPGYTSATTTQIQADIASYLNSLAIGETIVLSELIGAALNARPNPDQPLFSIRSLQAAASAALTTCSTTSGVDTITVADATGIADGQTIVAAGVPSGTTVTNVSGTTITMSANATATASDLNVGFYVMASDDVSPEFYQAALGVAANVSIVMV